MELIILARDDGSKDNTPAILNLYAQENLAFSYYIGNNLGPAQSFFDLLRNSPSADYYAFCDQDDVWDRDKLFCAVTALEEERNSTPNLYFF